MRQQHWDAAFTEYVIAKGPWLRKVAFLLCQDWHRADDLVQNGIIKLYVQRPQASTRRARGLAHLSGAPDRCARPRAASRHASA